MNKYWRLLAALGSLMFAVSFFLPPRFHNAPIAQFRVVSEMICGEATLWQHLAYIAVAITLCFAYLSATLCAIALLVGRRADGWARWLVLVCHLMGGVAITSLGITLILTEDSWPAPGVRWYAAVAPFILVGGMALLTYVSKSEKRLPVAILVASGLQLPLQLILMVMVIHHHDAYWGYLIGSVGVALATVGSVGGLLRSSPALKAGGL